MAITDLDEQLLVRAHQAGDERAFQQIVRSQHRALYAHAYRRLGNHESAEDAVQDTLLRAYRALPSFDGDLRLRAWLHRILTNVCHDEGKRRRRQVDLIDRLEAEPVEVAADPIEEAVLHDTVRIMSEALAELPESYREALVLRYVDGLSFREVAELTGVTEENARARVHRGRLALHKVLSRVSLMVAFLVPGFRRAQTPADGGAVAGAEPTVSLATQLTSHAVNMAPTLTRVAEVASATSGAKSSMVATAVAAAAAIAAPVAAYRVYDTTKTADLPAAMAEAAKDQETSFTSTSLDVLTVDGTSTTTSSSSTSSIAPGPTSTLPPSAVAPFAGDAPGRQAEAPPSTTTTTTPTPTTTAPPAEPTTVDGTIEGDAFDVVGVRPDFDVAGPIVLDGSGDPVAGRLQGGVYVADAVGGDAIAELTFVADDGRQLRIRFRGTLDAEEVADDATTWTMSGQYRVEGGESVGLAELGSARVLFRHVEGAPSSITFELSGQQASGGA